MGRAIPAGAIVSPNVDRHTATTTMDQSHSVAQAVILMDGMSAHFPFICYTAEARMFLQGHQVNRLELTLLIPL